MGDSRLSDSYAICRSMPDDGPYERRHSGAPKALVEQICALGIRTATKAITEEIRRSTRGRNQSKTVTSD